MFFFTLNEARGRRDNTFGFKLSSLEAPSLKSIVAKFHLN